jgi:hypothetical protein
MSLVKLLPAWLHAIADYAVGALLVIVALTVDMSTKATVAGVVVGATVLAVSAVTKYPLGIVKILSFRLHSAGDYAATALLFVAPFALGFNDTDTGVTVFYVAAGIAVLAVSLITNYQYGGATELVAAPVPGPTAAKATASKPPATRKPATRRTQPLKAQGR